MYLIQTHTVDDMICMIFICMYEYCCIRKQYSMFFLFFFNVQCLVFCHLSLSPAELHFSVENDPPLGLYTPIMVSTSLQCSGELGKHFSWRPCNYIYFYCSIIAAHIYYLNKLFWRSLQPRYVVSQNSCVISYYNLYSHW